jgi:hypothetical protein
VANRPRYVEKDSFNIEKEREKEREKEKEKEDSMVVMLLSDGCIEDITSMLFTTVVHNLSVIVGHNIDGLPLTPPPSARLSFLAKVMKTLGPLGLFFGRGEHTSDRTAYIPSPSPLMPSALSYQSAYHVVLHCIS